MLNLLLNATLLDFLSTPNKIVGIILAALGFGLSILAKRITRAIRKTDKINNNDPAYLLTLGIALCLMLVGLIITIV